MSLVGSLTRSLGGLSLRSTGAIAGPSRLAASSPSPSFSTVAATGILTASRPQPYRAPSLQQQVRHRSLLAPRRTKYRKAHKGRVPVPIGGSIKGTTLQQGAFGIRLLEPARLTAKQLTSAQTALKRKLKVIRGCQVFLRVFPDIPVCVKGNETRMGKGKGSFEYWACRAPVGRVIFEIGGDVEIREEVARDALRLAAAKLPVRSEIITTSSPPRLGSLLLDAIPPASAVGASGTGPDAQRIAEEMPELVSQTSKNVVN